MCETSKRGEIRERKSRSVVAWFCEQGLIDHEGSSQRTESRGLLYLGGPKRRLRTGRQRCGKKIKRMESQESREESYEGESDQLYQS